MPLATGTRQCNDLHLGGGKALTRRDEFLLRGHRQDFARSRLGRAPQQAVDR